MIAFKTRLLPAAIAFAFAGAGLPAAAQDKPIEIRFASWLPATHSATTHGLQPWIKSLEAASKGSIKVAFFPAQQLGKAADHYDMARDGIADITFVSPGYQAGRFPLFEATELPFLASKPGPGSAAIDAWYRKHAATEMKDVKVCLAHMHIGTLHSKKPITDPSQIKGLKVRPANGTVAQTMMILGGSNVQVSAPEARDALEKGVADAVTLPWLSTIQFNVDKIVKHHLDTRLYAATYVWAMNKSWYDKLSANHKKVLDDHCTNDWAAKVGHGWGDEEDTGRARLEKAGGHTFTTLTPEQLGAWKKATEPVVTQWQQAAEKKGVKAKEALDDLKRELATRNAAL
jgi:TRAP-type C4-dicarboxylate transport system substrate-binding protein